MHSRADRGGTLKSVPGVVKIIICRKYRNFAILLTAVAVRTRRTNIDEAMIVAAIEPRSSRLPITWKTIDHMHFKPVVLLVPLRRLPCQTGGCRAFCGFGTCQGVSCVQVSYPFGLKVSERTRERNPDDDPFLAPYVHILDPPMLAFTKCKSPSMSPCELLTHPCYRLRESPMVLSQRPRRSPRMKRLTPRLLGSTHVRLKAIINLVLCAPSRCFRVVVELWEFWLAGLR